MVMEPRYNACLNSKGISFSKIEMKKIFFIVAMLFNNVNSNAQGIKSVNYIKEINN